MNIGDGLLKKLYIKQYNKTLTDFYNDSNCDIDQTSINIEEVYD